MNPAPSARPRARLIGSDALRAVATVWVVVIHASAWGIGGGYSAANLIARFSVPVFTVLTGLLLAYRYGAEPVGAEFARRRLARTVIPWLIWIPIYIVFDIRVPDSVQADMHSIVRFVSLGGGHLWYLLLIPELYVVFALMPRKRPLLAAGVAIAVQVGLSLWRVYGPFPAPWVATLILQYGFLLFPFWIGYFAVGLALGQLWRPVPRRIRVAVGVLGPLAIVASGYLLLTLTFAGAPYAGFVAGTGAFLDPILPLLVFSITAWVLAVAPRLLQRNVALRGTVKTVADYSLGIYILHPIGLWFLGIWYGHNLKAAVPLSILWFLLMVAGSFLFGLIGTRIIAATPLAPAVGMNRRSLRSSVSRMAPRFG